MHSSRTQASSRKSHNDRNQQILKALLKETANKNCADCKTATHPRWASWNLGCFICIRCSGIHRSMGTHISKVKSVDLDSWTDEQVKSVVSWGNAKLNSFWEDGLPDNYIPDDSKIENFIRTKYEKKKWAKSGSIPDPNKITVTQQEKPVPALPQESINISKPQSNLLDLDFAATPSPANSVSSSSFTSIQQPQTQSLPNLQSSLLSDNNKLKLQQAQQTQQTQQSQQSQQSHHQQQQQQQRQQLNSRPDLKKSILSLYSTPTASTPNIYSQQQHHHQQQPYQPIVNSVQPARQQQQLFPLTQVNPWNNNTTASSSSTATTSKTSLDDDLFKNVWT